MALVHGKILKGDKCPYVDECVFKIAACNGEGCPFLYKDKHTVDFSCGAVRLFAIINKDNNDD